MSMDEFLVWRAYILKRGTINTARRIEQEVGLLRFMTARVNGDKESTIEDFLTHEGFESDEGQEPASFEAMAFIFQCHAPP